MIDDPCRFNYPAESCIVIGRLAKYVVDYGIGRMIGKAGALKLIAALRTRYITSGKIFEPARNGDL